MRKEGLSDPASKYAEHSMLGVSLLAAILLLPVLTLLWLAFSGNIESFLLIVRNVLPSAGSTTVFLMLGVGFLVALVGTVSAWLVSHYNFPFRSVIQWALLLPLAIPTYISAYTFSEFFSYTGPLQETVRIIGGYQSPRDYWFPDIRTTWGTIFVFGLVLYPYVYLPVRALFHMQGSNVTETARVLGASGWRLFFRVTLPLARPAIMLGIALAMMETINDIGAVEYLGTRTLTFSVFSVWLNQNDLAGAAQIALFLLVLMFLIIYLEHLARGSRQYHELGKSAEKRRHRVELLGIRGFYATGITSLPIIVGFGIPVYVLSGFVFHDLGQLFNPEILEAFVTTLILGATAAILALICGLFMSLALRKDPSKFSRFTIRLASMGYAIPGTLVAIGLLIPLAAFDNALDSVLRQWVGISSGLLLTGSGAVLVLAYVIRFMAMAEGNLENGLQKISPNLDMAARSLGRTKRQALSSVLLPIMRPVIIGAGLLVFVDVVKELSATILLRPFGMNTLATHVYDYASQGRVEDAALGCMLIVAAGIIPVMLLTRTLR